MTLRAGSKHTGFTFIELIFVALTLAVVMVAIVPRFEPMRTRLEAERTAFEVAQMLRSARVVAITQHQPVTWRWDEEARRMWLGVPQAGGDMTPVPGRFGQPRRLSERLALAVSHDDQPVTQIHFFPDGTSQSTLLLLTSDSVARYQIVVDGATSQVAVR